MNRKWLLLLAATDLFILSMLDKIAFRYFLYWRYYWFDLVMHFFGGLAIGCLSGWAFLEQNRDKKLEINNLLIFTAVFALAVGIVWELFEFWTDRVMVISQLDSLKDILVGVVGSLLAGVVVGETVLWRRKKRIEQEN